MDNFKKFMTFSRGERIAIITIVSMIVISLISKYLIISNSPKRDYFKHDLDSIIARREAVLDSIRIADSIQKSISKTDGKACLAPMGYENVSATNRQKQQKSKTTRTDKACLVRTTSAACLSIDLNTADTTQLKQLPGIGASFAKWIVNYREKLGGYCETEQLLEVYRMDSVRFNDIKNYVKIDSTFIPNKLKINTDAFKILLKHPYLEYEDVKKIVNHREQKGLITSWEQLVKIVGDGIKPELRYYIDYK
ncbi:MAG: helix-hairpin-helix domain-containing protein [Bacteroidales bacterium]|nr:helix-hairpin-helix domain-containing protein [Bacteroidales bacterium]